MKVINKSETKDEKWYVGDVIEYGDHSYTEKKHVMIIRVVDISATITPARADDYLEDSTGIKYSTVRLDGGFDGDLGAFSSEKWVTGGLYSDMKALKEAFMKACVYAKKVPFYGVVGKPEVK